MLAGIKLEAETGSVQMNLTVTLPAPVHFSRLLVLLLFLG